MSQELLQHAAYYLLFPIDSVAKCLSKEWEVHIHVNQVIVFSIGGFLTCAPPPEPISPALTMYFDFPQSISFIKDKTNTMDLIFIHHMFSKSCGTTRVTNRNRSIKRLSQRRSILYPFVQQS